jgi:type IV secretory pathway protease TraF
MAAPPIKTNFKSLIISSLTYSYEEYRTSDSGYILLEIVAALRDELAAHGLALNVNGDEDLSIKRIIAAPGDRVRLDGGKVYVNGTALDERYLAPGTETLPGYLTRKEYEIQPDCYFVLGDNRSCSCDSRHEGAVPRDQIIGRIHSPVF